MPYTGGKARGRKAPHSKTSLVQRYIDSEYGAAVYPSDNIHRATCTGSSYASINGFYGGIHQLRDHEQIQNMHGANNGIFETRCRYPLCSSNAFKSAIIKLGAHVYSCDAMLPFVL